MAIIGDMAVAVTTGSGTQLYPFGPEHMTDLRWTRSASEISVCELSVPQIHAPTPELEVAPWMHYVSVWDDRSKMMWRGPVQRTVTEDGTTQITARDIGAFMAKTRTPMTNSWDAAMPTAIARELWELMIEQHDLRVVPLVRPDPLGDPFDFETTRDAKKLSVVMDELVNVGLRWYVVGGTPVLGPWSMKPFEALSEDHFASGKLRLVRDGAGTANDILVRGGDANIGRARRSMPGRLNLQEVITLESIFGVSNVDRAARQYARHFAAFRDQVQAAGPIELRHDAPVTIDQLIPTARVTVEAFNRMTVMEIDTVEVRRTSEGVSVAVTLDSVNDDLPELADGGRFQES